MAQSELLNQTSEYETLLDQATNMVAKLNPDRDHAQIREELAQKARKFDEDHPDGHKDYDNAHDYLRRVIKDSDAKVIQFDTILRHHPDNKEIEAYNTAYNELLDRATEAVAKQNPDKDRAVIRDELNTAALKFDRDQPDQNQIHTSFDFLKNVIKEAEPKKTAYDELLDQATDAAAKLSQGKDRAEIREAINRAALKFDRDHPDGHKEYNNAPDYLRRVIKDAEPSKADALLDKATKILSEQNPGKDPKVIREELIKGAREYDQSHPDQDIDNTERYLNMVIENAQTKKGRIGQAVDAIIHKFDAVKDKVKALLGKLDATSDEEEKEKLRGELRQSFSKEGAPSLQDALKASERLRNALPEDAKQYLDVTKAQHSNKGIKSESVIDEHDAKSPTSVQPGRDLSNQQMTIK